jgi:type VI secretion system protein ImpM
LFGKLPSHGDFLRRRASDAFVDAWDAWLRECLSESRATLGDRWLDIYLTSPAWRFVCAPGACGPAAVIGLMVPSVDRVGRYFPLTLVAELPEDVSPIGAATSSTMFFDRAERLVIDTLAAEEIDFERFDEHVVRLGETLESVTLPPLVALDRAASGIAGDGGQAWQIPLGDVGQLAPALEQVLALRLASLYQPLVMWWTEGSSVVEPSCLIAKGLPQPADFSALLDGDWGESRWRAVSAASISVRRSTCASRNGGSLPIDRRGDGVGRVRRSTKTRSSNGRRRDLGVADGLGDTAPRSRQPHGL